MSMMKKPTTEHSNSCNNNRRWMRPNPSDESRNVNRYNQSQRRLTTTIPPLEESTDCPRVITPGNRKTAAPSSQIYHQPYYERENVNSYSNSKQRFGSCTLVPLPRSGRGNWVSRKEDENSGERHRGYKKAQRLLVPENKVELEKWIPRVMSPSDVVDLARQCIDVTDAFIKLDSFLDRNKRYNSSNLDQLRHEQRMCQQQKEMQPDGYVELIAQCQANPGVFPGTQHCLDLVFGTRRLEEFVRQRAWTEEQLREWNITTDWQMFDKKVSSDESLGMMANSTSIINMDFHTAASIEMLRMNEGPSSIEPFIPPIMPPLSSATEGKATKKEKESMHHIEYN